MRLVETIPHDRFTIQVFAWNGKYLLKIELDQYEQTFKIPETDVMGAGALKTVLTPDFLHAVLKIFVEMRTVWLSATQSVRL